MNTFLKGDSTATITLALAEGFDYSGKTVCLEYQGVKRSFSGATAGGTLAFFFNAEETAPMSLGTYPVRAWIEDDNGNVTTINNADVKMRVTDCIADVRSGSAIYLDVRGGLSGIDGLPERYTDEDVRIKINEILLRLGGTVAMLLLCALPVFGASLSLHTAPKGVIYNDQQVVTNATLDVSDLVTTGQLATAVGAIPAPDFTVSNDTLVATIEATAPAPGDYATVSNRAMSALQSYTETDPTVPAWSKKELSDMYANNLYQLLNRDFFAKDSSIQTPNKVYITGTSSTVTVGKGPTGSSYPYSVLGRNRFEVYGEDYNHVAHYRQEGVKVWPWWDDEAEDYAMFLLPTNSAGGTFALTSDIPSVGDYATVSNRAMSAVQTESDPTVPEWAKAESAPTYTAADVGAVSTNGGVISVNGDANRRLLLGKVGLVPLGGSFERKGQGRAAFAVMLEDGTDRECSLYLDDDGKTYINTAGGWVQVPDAPNGGTLALTSDIPASMAWGAITGKPTTISGYGITDALSADDLSSAISATNTAFSNAVLSVGLNIDTNTVAQINALVEQGEEMPVGSAATVGGLLLALAAAVAALKRDKANKVANATAGNLATLTAQGNLADAGYHFEVRGGIPCIVQYT